MHKPTALLIGIFFATMAIGADAPPSAREILDQVRLQQSQQQLDLQGQLRSDATVIPFRITQTGPVIRYTFTNPAEVVQLRLGEDGTRLDLVLQNSTKKFSSSRLDERIGGTAVTYGDLALKFLYWPNAQVIGADTLRTRNCWKLRLAAPSKDAPYATVLLWVDKESGALMRMEGYDWKGQLKKRFEVVSAQKIEGRWFLKQMRIEEMEPGASKVRSRSYLEIKK
jgi:Outer membrane lipoprotein-sorting protein